MAAINQTTQSMGLAMRQARVMAYIPRNELCQILHISTQELTLFETGQRQMPLQLMQALFAHAFTQMRARTIQNKYMQYARRLRDVGLLDLTDENGCAGCAD